jgi:eukaryotic-like serine/threonine-protein kinase
MSLCINPNCPTPINQDTLLFCQTCHSELLLDARYRVIRQLGGGGFGKTYEVLDSALYNPVSGASEFKVLKVLIHNHPKYIELFRREAHFLAQIDDPGVPKVESDAYFQFHPANSTEIVHCLVMEKIEGLDLKKYISQRGAGISEKRAIQWLMQLARILSEIHQRNFFHRDIKPSNIMLRASGQLVLIDFGTAREVTGTYISKQDAGQLTGLFSAGYSPIEQMNGQAILQSDFFALGRTIVYLLTGRNPSDMYDAVRNKLLWRQYAPNLSDRFADFLDALMAESPMARPSSAEVIVGELIQLYHQLFESDSSSSFPTNLPIAGTTRTSASPEMTLADPDATVIAKPEPYRSSVTFPPEKPHPVALEAHSALETRSLIDTRSVIDTRFINRCQRELTELIGPMAAIICQRTLAKNPSLSSVDFVCILARSIPDPQVAEDFQTRLLA